MQYTSNVEKTVCANENARESHSTVWNTFHADMEKRNEEVRSVEFM
jgi:hypothetical protein